ncbi:MAG: DUF882 domain-containing protein, partial [Pseudomonadota bacterium]
MADTHDKRVVTPRARTGVPPGAAHYLRAPRQACARPIPVMLLVLMVFGAGLMVASPSHGAKERAIALYNIHTRENITIVYKRGGKFVKPALKKLNWFLRDWRQDQEITIEPKLFDLLFDIHKELGSERPIHVISAYRSPRTNAMLRKSRGGQARKSYHMRGMAIDVHFPDVSIRQLRYSALIRERGGVGYYPTSSIPFVHVDVGRVRHWPRMKRQELALLFRRGRSRHIPSDGKPLRPADVAAAKKARPQLAMTVASFHDLRRYGPRNRNTWSAGTQIARASVPRTAPRPPAPRLVASAMTLPRLRRAEPAPRLVAPPRLAATAAAGQGMLQHLASLGARDKPVSTDGKRLDQLASLASTPTAAPNNAPLSAHGARTAVGGLPKPGAGPRAIDSETSWVPAPEFDDDHSEEMFYTPFPVSPYLTDTPSVDDDALVVMR